MKELLFQAWNIQERRMYDVTSMLWSTTPDGQRVIYKLDLCNNDETQQYRHVFDARTIQKNYVLRQYTGIQDRHNRKIFDGDILLLLFGKHRLEVRWGMISYKFFDIGLQDWRLLYTSDLKRLEVIGNIHETPELLERAS